MTITSRIRAFQLAVSLAAILMAVFVYLNVRSTTYYFERAQLSRHQLDATVELALHANRFSEQIAELLLIGEPERPDFESARIQTAAALARLRRITLEEIEFVRGSSELEEELLEVDRLDRMQVLFREIDRAVERLLLLDQQGLRDQAVALFRSDIENRLDAEFEELIAEAVDDERSEAITAGSVAIKYLERQLIGTLTLAAVLLAIAIVSGFLLARSLRVPLKALTEGAIAIERGDLDRRIAYSRRDEFGLVAQRFNSMADELRRQRQALLHAQDELEQRVAERTRDLGEAISQLTQLDQQRVRFLADISHELRTPVTVLRGEAEVTLRGASQPEGIYRAALAKIAAQAADLGCLIDDLLFLARSEADEIRFEFRPVALHSVIMEAVEDAAMMARDRKVPISTRAGEKGPIVQADHRRLKQAILIVLDNAIKYAEPQKGIQVELGVVNGGEAQIVVKDHGLGIPPEEVAHVFDRFYRGAKARGKGVGGSGLGLAIARWIIEKHDGTIDLRALQVTAPKFASYCRRESP